MSKPFHAEIPSRKFLAGITHIFFEKGMWNVVLAPTYTGCPAIDVIPILVEVRLKEEGFENIKIEMSISPPWSTDWISEEGKEKLMQYGIAPPQRKNDVVDHEGRPKKCPQCGSEATTLISRFSSTACKAAYRCDACQEPFEYFKCY